MPEAAAERGQDRGSEHHRIREAVVTALVWAGVLAVVLVFLWVLIDLASRGAAHLGWSFLLDAPRSAGREGGIAPIILSTLLILAVCMAVSIPVGLGTAALLGELTDIQSRFGQLVRRSLDALAAVPSIVFGLFGAAFFCVYLGMGFSILAGGLTLTCMVLPIFIRAAEEGIRSVPEELRQGAAALGLSRATTLRRIVLPVAVPGLAAGFALAVGRALAETAALIFTSGYVDRYPESLLDSGRAMSVHIYDLAMNVPGGNANAYATALVLLALVLLVNGAAARLSGRFTAKIKERA